MSFLRTLFRKLNLECLVSVPPKRTNKHFNMTKQILKVYKPRLVKSTKIQEFVLGKKFTGTRAGITVVRGESVGIWFDVAHGGPEAGVDVESHFAIRWRLHSNMSFSIWWHHYGNSLHHKELDGHTNHRLEFVLCIPKLMSNRCCCSCW